MTTGSSFIEGAKRATIAVLCLVLIGCGASEPAPEADGLERMPPAIVCLAYLDLQADAVRQARESGNLQSMADAKTLWRNAALAAASAEQVEDLTRAVKEVVVKNSSAEIGDEAANCIARAPRYAARR